MQRETLSETETHIHTKQTSSTSNKRNRIAISESYTTYHIDVQRSVHELHREIDQHVSRSRCEASACSLSSHCRRSRPSINKQRRLKHTLNETENKVNYENSFVRLTYSVFDRHDINFSRFIRSGDWCGSFHSWLLRPSPIDYENNDHQTMPENYRWRQVGYKARIVTHWLCCLATVAGEGPCLPMLGSWW